MNNRLVLILGLALIASGCASTSNPDQQAEEPDQEADKPPEPSTPTDNSNQTSEEASETSNNTVRLTDSGFQPSTITIEQGETVTWVNEGSTAMWVGSDRHPTHTDYSGTSTREHCEDGDQTSAAFDQCSTGEEFSFTFEKTGEWGYHNHVASAQKGTVIVE